MSVNFLALEQLVEANERAPGFDLSSWSCGTFGCLVGNFCIAHPADALALNGVHDLIYRGEAYENFSAAAARFGLSDRESIFLFSPMNDGAAPDSYVYPEFFCELSTSWIYGDRDTDDRHAAINRVRKFIAYKRKKAAIFASGELARRQEGDWMVVRHAQEELARVAERTVAV